jgi:hypothetical protein
MYNNFIADIEREIIALREQRDCEILYWFEMGESDRTSNLPPKYPANDWYMIGYEDRQYQLEIGFNSENCNF